MKNIHPSKENYRESARIILIDNYDSYTYNVSHLIEEITGSLPVVIQNDDFETFEEMTHTYKFPEDYDKITSVIISPGPGTPLNRNDVLLSESVVKACIKRNIPLFGICLGHQIISHLFNYKIRLASEPMHGRISPIFHVGTNDPESLFFEIPSPFEAVRYHSLVAQQLDNKSSLKIIGWTVKDEEKEIMAVAKKDEEASKCPCFGVQFHPESICTIEGKKIMENFIRLSDAWLKTIGEKKAMYVKEVSLEGLNDASEKMFAEYLKQRKDRENGGIFYLDSSKSNRTSSAGNTRFSYIGSSAGPASFFVDYSLEENEFNLRVFRQEKDSKNFRVAVIEKDADLFHFLDKELQDRRNNVPVYKVANEGIEKVADSLTNQKLIQADFLCGFVGYFGYELRHICGIKSLQDNFSLTAAVKKQRVLANGYCKKTSSESIPTSAFLFCDRVMIFDEANHKCFLSAYTEDFSQKQLALQWIKQMETFLQDLKSSKPCQKLPTVDKFNGHLFEPEVLDQFYMDQVQKCREYIRQEESYEICLTQRLSMKLPKKIDPGQFYRFLRRHNPAPYSSFLSFKFDKTDLSVCSCSPERFLKIQIEPSSSGLIGKATSKPIKGTIRRSADPAEDERLKQTLINSQKDRSENLMIVDLVRNDLGRVCYKVQVENLFNIESFETVHQMVSTIHGYFDPAKTTPLKVIRACFPGGSMTGAPKKRSMELINSLEKSQRGLYSGSIGFISLNGNCDFNIVIRTLLFDKSKISVGSGGAITYLSDPKEELEEMKLKIRVLESALWSYLN
eukprot:maker-scaffold_6-snap-gene-11.62-mRNA-1 protein AED:0.02 eAED:0.03 QI:0/0.33/0.25/1/1/1/4/238/789